MVTPGFRFLFAGPGKTGKSRAARVLARAAFDEQASLIEPSERPALAVIAMEQIAGRL